MNAAKCNVYSAAEGEGGGILNLVHAAPGNFQRGSNKLKREKDMGAKNGLAGNRTPDHPHAKGVLYH